MSNDQAVEVVAKELTHTAFFSRKVSGPKQYESYESAIYVQFNGDPTDTERFEANARKAFYEAKGLVYSELGIPFNADSDGIIRELVEKTFPGAVQVSNTPKAPAPVNRAPAPTAGSEAPQIAPRDLGGGITLKGGKFGPFVTDGTTNASLPKYLDADTVTYEKAAELIANKRAKAGQ